MEKSHSPIWPPLSALIVLHLLLSYDLVLRTASSGSLVQASSHALQHPDKSQKTALPPAGSEPMLMKCGPQLRKLSMHL
jgi:hypothetical protein